MLGGRARHGLVICTYSQGTAAQTSLSLEMQSGEDGRYGNGVTVHSTDGSRNMRERLRLETLIARGGVEQAKQWAKKTAVLYCLSIRNPTHYASQPDWKPLFEESIEELKNFVHTGEIS